MQQEFKKEVKKVIRQLCHDHYDYKTGTVSTPRNGVEDVFHAESYKKIDRKVLIEALVMLDEQRDYIYYLAPMMIPIIIVLVTLFCTDI